MRCKIFLQRRLVIERQTNDIIRLIDRRDDRRIVRCGHRQRRPSMKGFAKGYHLFPAIVETGQFQRILIGLRSGVAKEEAIIGPAGYPAELFGQLFLKRNMNGIGIEPYLVQLVGDPLDIMRMSMTDRNDRMATIQIEILLPFLVPHIGAFCLYDSDIIDRINVE